MDKSNDKFVWLELFYLILIKAVRGEVQKQSPLHTGIISQEECCEIAQRWGTFNFLYITRQCYRYHQKTVSGEFSVSG